MAVGYQSRPENPSAFESDLAAQQQIAQELEQERREARRNSAKDGIKDYARDRLKQEGKRLAQDAMRSSARAAARMGARTAATAAAEGAVAAGGSTIGLPVAIGVVAIICAILFVLMVVFGMFMSIYYACNNSSASTGVKVISYLGSWVGYEDVCAMMTMEGTTGPGDIQQPTQPMPPSGTNLVAITGIPVEGASDPRLKECMLAQMQSIYTEAQRKKIDFVITSAYRPGAVVGDTDTLSAHGRGEAVDIAIRPKGSLSDPAFQKKIRELVAISLAAGFRPPMGDTLDEYNKPTVAATGGHIHIEYNLPKSGSYCTLPTRHDQTSP